MLSENKICVIVGASHGGVTAAFALRKEGWSGQIILYDADPELPYHRPPLSKAFLTSEGGIENYSLKPAHSYEKDKIELRLGVRVASIDREAKTIFLENGSSQKYGNLILATGARPLMPPIPGLATAQNTFPLRTAQNVENIRRTLERSATKKVVIIGGGYIGLEIAASLKKLGAGVTVLERETRLLARVTAPEMSVFFRELHERRGVVIHTAKNVISIENQSEKSNIHCSDGSIYEAELLIIGVGITLNDELAGATNMTVTNGIRVSKTTQTSDEAIYAIGDVTNYFSPHYQRFVRLESVQNAVDQAKVAAANICGKETVYDAIPWFWSDQFDVKLQMVGLSAGYDEVAIRTEEGDGLKISAWYFKGDELVAVDAVNNAKAYVLGTKFIKDNTAINKANLVDAALLLKAENLVS